MSPPPPDTFRVSAVSLAAEAGNASSPGSGRPAGTYTRAFPAKSNSLSTISSFAATSARPTRSRKQEKVPETERVAEVKRTGKPPLHSPSARNGETSTGVRCSDTAVPRRSPHATAVAGSASRRNAKSPAKESTRRRRASASPAQSPPRDRDTGQAETARDSSSPLPKRSEQRIGGPSKLLRGGRDKPPGLLVSLGGAPKIPNKFQGAGKRDGHPEEGGGGLLDAVGLVENHGVGDGKNIPSPDPPPFPGRVREPLPLSPDRQVGKVQVVVHHHQVRRLGAAADVREETTLGFRAGRGVARLAPGAYLRPGVEVVGNARAVGEVAGEGRLGETGPPRGGGPPPPHGPAATGRAWARTSPARGPAGRLPRMHP